MLSGFTGPVQIAYAVDDVHVAATAWEARGVSPFHVREHISVANARVGGRPAEFDHSSAFAQFGDVMVELICEHSGTDVARVGPTTGVHHLAFFVDDFAAATAALTDRGYPELLYAEAGATPFAFHDARGDLGHLIEIYECTPPLVDFYAMVRERSLAR